MYWKAPLVSDEDSGSARDTDSAGSTPAPPTAETPSHPPSAQKTPQSSSISLSGSRGVKALVTWRAAALLALAIAAFVIGLLWKKDGSPPSDSLGRHQVIQIFVSDPNAQVQLTAAYAGLGKDRMLENLYLSIIPPRPKEDVEWALLSLDHSMDCNFPVLGNVRAGRPTQPLASELLFGLDPKAPRQRAWLCEGDTLGTSLNSLATLKGEAFPGIGLLQRADPLAAEITNGSFVASTPFPPVDATFSGDLFARIPALDLEQLPQPGVALIIGFQHDHGQLQYLLNEDPRPRSSGDLGSGSIAAYQKLPNAIGVIPTPFFVPSNIRTQALLELTDTQSRLLNYRIDQVDPSNGSFDNGNFMWSGTGYIEPTVAMSDPNVDQTRSSDELLAGIALGIAASAFIAFLQELPRGAKRRRKKGEAPGPHDSPSTPASSSPVTE
jgi:hypothetical protein